MTGRLITFEGGDGAGKSTQIARLADYLDELGIPVLCTREPGGTAGAEAIRTLLVSGEADWEPLAEAMLHFAARREHVEKFIRPAVVAGPGSFAIGSSIPRSRTNVTGRASPWMTRPRCAGSPLITCSPT